ncbi:hypothetical protein [Chelativorans sp. Marseille-P2723]|uniref:hypothetical protein n=1 Tax=Chelativorans sp. Marseille-P2723 TaxID=2709133 RepID=UPI00156E1253|nr:hypothetical protein [Chelativorans sp. Marseille-P2723]
MTKYQNSLSNAPKFNPINDWRKSIGTNEAEKHKKLQRQLQATSNRADTPKPPALPLPHIELPIGRPREIAGRDRPHRSRKPEVSLATQFKAAILLSILGGGYASQTYSQIVNGGALNHARFPHDSGTKPAQSGKAPGGVVSSRSHSAATGQAMRQNDVAAPLQQTSLEDVPLGRFPRHSGLGGGDLPKGAENKAIAAVILARTRRSLAESDTAQLQRVFKKLNLAWKKLKVGKDPCREVATWLAFAKGLRGQEAERYIHAAAQILRVKYGVLDTKNKLEDSQATTFDEVFGHELPANRFEQFEQSVMNVMTSILAPIRWEDDKRAFREETRSFEFDPLTKIPIRVSGLDLSLKEIANSYYMMSVYPEMDETERLEHLQSAFDRLGIDTAFPFGALHVVSTLVKRLSGEQYETSELSELLKTFITLNQQLPDDELKLHAAWYIAIENGWPELNLDDPVAAKDELVSSFNDLVHIDTAPPPVFNPKVVALKVLMEKTGLSFEELIARPLKRMHSPPRVHLVFHPDQGPAKYMLEPSILDEFLENSEWGSDDTRAYTDEKQQEMRRTGTAYTSRLMTVKTADGGSVELKPFEALEEARKQFIETLPSNPWVQAAARVAARTKTRPQGYPPSREGIEAEIPKIVQKLRPNFQHDENLDQLRNWFTNIGLFGEILKVPYLLSDLVEGLSEGDFKALTYNSPVIGNIRQLADATNLASEGEVLTALDTAMASLPNIGDKWQVGSSVVKGDLADAIFILAGMGKKTGGSLRKAPPLQKPKVSHPIIENGRPLATLNGMNPGWGAPSDGPEADPDVERIENIFALRGEQQRVQAASLEDETENQWPTASDG